MLQIDSWKRISIWLTIAIGLLLALPNGFYTRVEQSNDAEALLVAEVGPAEEDIPALEETAGQWPGFMPSGLVNLGLDLRGGAHLLAEVQVTDVHERQMTALWPAARDALLEAVGPIRQQDGAPDELRIRISDADAVARAVEVAQGLGQPVQTITGALASTLDVRSEGDVVIITLSDEERDAMDNRTVLQALEVIRLRIDAAGTREPTIQRQGEDRILIQVPGVGSAEEIKILIGTPAVLSFHHVIDQTGNENFSVDPTQILVPSVDFPGTFYILEKTAVLTGEYLVEARPDFNENGSPAVGFRFNPTGARIFGDYTAENIGLPFAIVLDDEVISAPTIQAHISGGSGIITGQFTVEETTALAVQLGSGSLPAGLTFLEERTIGPELGQDSIDAGKIACIVAFGAVLVFMGLSYGLFGLFANVALIINIGLIFGLLSLVGATLTLPGIAGIVLTIGMAVDANVLIFERIREELKTAKGPARAIELGYEKALSAIIDANITTFITAVILFAMGSGPVRGFSITLGLGIMTSVFTAIFVTRLLIVMWFERRRPRTIEV